MDAAAFLETVTRWIADHPDLAGWVVFLIAAGESLAVVGLFVPGAVLMFVIGALVGSGVMALWPTLAWAVAGAVVGDGISYWLGRYYHDRLRLIWPFTRHPALIEKGEVFFRRHGGKGVLFGRFVGPVRPIIPVVAGMMDMPAWRFSLINVFSALLWAPAYILPGVVFSSSLSMATEVAGRLAILMLLLFSVVLVTLWLIRRVFWLLQPRANPVIGGILRWSRRHPFVGQIAEALLDPEHPEARGLAVLSATLFLAVTLSVLLITALQESRLLGNLDLLIFNALQTLRTPWADQVMVFVTWFGDRAVVALLLAVITLWLAWAGAWRVIFHLLAAALCSEAMVLVLKMVSAIERPVPLSASGIDLFSFPSEHTALATTVYGMLAIIAAGALPVVWRWLPYALAGALAALIGFSRLYLGAQWFSDVLGGFGVGVMWAALVGIAYRRHVQPEVVGSKRRRVGAARLALVTVTGLVVAAVWGEFRFDRELARYEPVTVSRPLDMAFWWEQGWRELPAYRADFRGLRDHPLTVQWAGSLGVIRERLSRTGWRSPPPLDLPHALRMLASREDPLALPVLPQVNGGRHEALRLVQPLEEERLLVLRLWATDRILTPGDVPLWQGNVSYLRFTRLAGLFTVGRTEVDFSGPLNLFTEEAAAMQGVLSRRVHRQVPGNGVLNWDGEVILLRFAGSPSSSATHGGVPGAPGDR